MNDRFDLDAWLRRFPLEEEYGRYSAQIITSPWHLCQNEHLRRAMHDEYDWGPAVPMDVFVMADGEPVERHVTKIGGLPYRPASAPWPSLPGNVPLVFLAQFNFGDSRDLTGTLPGDVLLVFADSSSNPTYLHFEWQPNELAILVQEEDLPAPPDEFELEALRRDQTHFGPICVAWGRLGIEIPDQFPHPTGSFQPCHGQRVRTLSFPEARPRNDESVAPLCRGNAISQEWLLLSYQATQIGAAPFFVQEVGPGDMPGRVLCTISSVQPEMHRPYPWLNHPSALLPADEWRLDDRHLMIGDMGCIYIVLADNGELHWHMSCY